MSLLFIYFFYTNILLIKKQMLSRLVITFLPRSKYLLISWLQSPSAVILEPPKIKSDVVSTVSLSISHEVMRPDAMTFVFWILSFKPTFSLFSCPVLLSETSLSTVCQAFCWVLGMWVNKASPSLCHHNTSFLEETYWVRNYASVYQIIVVLGAIREKLQK